MRDVTEVHTGLLSPLKKTEEEQEEGKGGEEVRGSGERKWCFFHIVSDVHGGRTFADSRVKLAERRSASRT